VVGGEPRPRPGSPCSLSLLNTACKKPAPADDLLSGACESPERPRPDWQEILERDGRSVWQTAYRLLGNRADADECFQEAFLEALEVARREPVRHWGGLLRRLAAVRAVDRLRRRYRQGVHLAVADWETLPGPSPSPAQAVADSELAERLRAALACLPPVLAKVFSLHALEDWSYQETARHLAISVDSVGVLLHRARKRLRRLMGASPESSCGPAAEERSSRSRKDRP
jgi:RNA polymerase sigma-70 factor (ECF subfamily)